MLPLIINLAPTGLVPTRAQSPYIPLNPAEIALDVSRCVELGVGMVHIHAREIDGSASNDASIFADIIYRIRCQHPELVVVTTTSGRRVSDVEKRASTLYLSDDLKPDMASLTLGSMNFSQDTSVNSPATIMRLAEIMQERGIRPELEVFDVGMINFAHVLIEKGLLSPPYYFNILLGNLATAQLKFSHLAALINDLPPGSTWSLAGIGRFQAQACALGVVMGDGVRVGLEDNLWLDGARTALATNTQLVERIVAQAQSFERPIASAREVRARLGLSRLV